MITIRIEVNDPDWIRKLLVLTNTETHESVWFQLPLDDMWIRLIEEKYAYLTRALD